MTSHKRPPEFESGTSPLTRSNPRINHRKEQGQVVVGSVGVLVGPARPGQCL